MGASRKQLDTWLFRLVVGSVLVMWAGLTPMLTHEGRTQDFLNLYTGARLARDGEWSRMHDPALQLKYEREVMPERTVLVPFVRPHAYALLLMPLSAMPHRISFWVWFSVQILAGAGTLWWAARRFGRAALLWGLMFPGLALATMLGQDPAVLLATAAAGWSLAERDKPRAAGFVWGLGLVKFHLLLGLAVALLVGRKWKMLQGFAAAGLLLASVGLALGGVAGSETYIRMLTNQPDVVFLAVSTDEDRDAVAPFLKAQKWHPLAYFEDGLAATLRINSIPTAMILDRQGNIVSRLNGFIADRFVDMMSDRIREALEEK